MSYTKINKFDVDANNHNEIVDDNQRDHNDQNDQFDNTNQTDEIDSKSSICDIV